MKLFVLKFICLFYLVTCSSNHDYSQTAELCDFAYETSEIHFSKDDPLTMSISFVYFSDSTNEISNVDFNKMMTIINNFYAVSNLKFVMLDSVEIVDSLQKRDMPSFIKYHKIHNNNNDSSLICYIYGDEQPNYVYDKANVSGSAAGIGSTFFAVRRAYMYRNTILHELGHCLGLYHIDTPDTSPDGYTILSGDKVCDTPKSVDTHSSVSRLCEYIGTEPYSELEKDIIICNIMSYVYYKCRNCFTQGQIDKIRWTIHESGDLRKIVSQGIYTESL